jgi:hypothetical protein
VPTHGGDKCLVQASAPISLFVFPAGKKKRETVAAREREKKKGDGGWVNGLSAGRN